MGMTYVELQRRMSDDEFSLHIALATLRSEECPNCGISPRDMMEFERTKIKCPVCSIEYDQTHRVGFKPKFKEDDG